jgi:hypothetical protein
MEPEKDTRFQHATEARGAREKWREKESRAGLPDFPFYNIPKCGKIRQTVANLGTYLVIGHTTYNITAKYTKLQ